MTVCEVKDGSSADSDSKPLHYDTPMLTENAEFTIPRSLFT